MRALVKCIGYIGDNLFASSVCEPLKWQSGFDYVDLKLTVSAPYELLNSNLQIDRVYLPQDTIDESVYDKVFQLRPINRLATPCEQFQIQCGIPSPTSTYRVCTNQHIDTYVNTLLPPNMIKVAVLQNWEERSFLYTKEQYAIGIDVPNLGYGGSHRNVNYIIASLQQHSNVMLIPVGKLAGYDQTKQDIATVSEYTLTASLIKACDWFIGSEGGLANLSAGVGTKTILTSDFVHQLYGPNGVIERVQNPMLGPAKYFPNAGHIELDPYLTDEEVYKSIINIIL